MQPEEESRTDAWLRALARSGPFVLMFALVVVLGATGFDIGGPWPLIVGIGAGVVARMLIRLRLGDRYVW